MQLRLFAGHSVKTAPETVRFCGRLPYILYIYVPSKGWLKPDNAGDKLQQKQLFSRIRAIDFRTE